MAVYLEKALVLRQSVFNRPRMTTEGIYNLKVSNVAINNQSLPIL